jgi:hypothetical protein
MNLSKPRSPNKTIALISSIIIGTLSVLLPNYLDKLWASLGYSTADRSLISLSVSIIFFVAIPILLIQLDIDDLAKKIESESDITSMTNNEGMRDASKTFIGADLVINTRIIFGDVDQFDFSEAGSIWDQRLLMCVNQGTHFRELVSTGCELQARRRLLSFKTSKNKTPKNMGLYEARVVSQGSSFINFVIVTRGRERTLWFGWLVAPGTTHDMVYKTMRHDLIEMFEQYFNDQFRVGAMVS